MISAAIATSLAKAPYKQQECFLEQASLAIGGEVVWGLLAGSGIAV